MAFLIMLLYSLSIFAAMAILLAAAWRAMRALEEIARGVASIDATLRGRTGRDG